MPTTEPLASPPAVKKEPKKKPKLQKSPTQTAPNPIYHEKESPKAVKSKPPAPRIIKVEDQEDLVRMPKTPMDEETKMSSFQDYFGAQLP